MHIVVYSNFNRDADIAVVDMVVDHLKTKPCTFNLASFKEAGFLEHNFIRLSDCVHEADIIIAVGGDGTVLRAVSDVANAQLEIPILAINRGFCGFLTDTEPKDMKEAVDKLFTGEYDLEKRMIFKVRFGDRAFYTLNEVIVYKGNVSRPIVVSANYDNDKHIATVQGDGVYVSTPTGSTAYSLSCGGPVLAPDTNAIVLGAICPHNLVSRPIVFADSHIISLQLGKGFDDARLLIDGEVKARIYDATPVVIKKSKFAANLIKIKDIDFYSKLLVKLSSWTRLVGNDTDSED